MLFADIFKFKQGSKYFFWSTIANMQAAMYQKTTHSFYRLQVKSNKTNIFRDSSIKPWKNIDENLLIQRNRVNAFIMLNQPDDVKTNVTTTFKRKLNLVT